MAVVGASAGIAPVVKVFNENGAEVHTILAYAPGYRGGVNVAQGDVTGDSVPDIIVSQATGNSQVKVFDGVTFKQVGRFWAFDRSYRGGVNIATGALRDTGTTDIIAGEAKGGSLVRVFDTQNKSLITEFTAYGPGVDGVNVAAANLDGGAQANVVTAPARGGPPLVKAFDLRGQEVRSFLAYDASFTGGVNLAAGDFSATTGAEIVTGPGPGAPGAVRVFSNAAGNPLVSEFFPFGNDDQAGVLVGAVHVNGSTVDDVAVAREPARGASRASLSSFTTVNVAGAALNNTPLRALGVRGLNLSSAAAELPTTYKGLKQYGAAYNPTWPNWSPTANPQLNDSDFFNSAFAGLWGTDGTGQGRNDLTTISNSGVNLVRLYNWGPSRKGPSGRFDAHQSFLDKANQLGMKVIVPVSDYFLSSSQYAWVNNPQQQKPVDPDANYSFMSAPQAIRDDLMQFVDSITKNNKLNPAVQSISIGNEMDLGITTSPDATSKLKRAIWWVVNLQAELSKRFGTAVPLPFLTIPISNADQSDVWSAGTSTGSNTSTTLNDTNLGAHPPWATNLYAGLPVRIIAGTGTGQERTIASNTTTQLTVTTPWDTTPDRTSQYQIVNPEPVAWFQIFDHGATKGERVPTGTVPDGPQGRFTDNVKGLSTYDWYNTWFYNSLNMFQTGTQLHDTLTQYDTGTPTGTAWTNRWPGEKLPVPLLITELGTSRFDTTQAKQSDSVALDQAQVVSNVLKTSTNLMGYTIFEFNDEPNKNGDTGPAGSENFFGVTMYNTEQSQFRNGHLLYNLQTGTMNWAGGTLPNYTYPVYELIPVQTSDGTTLLSKLKSIFSQVR